MIFGNISDVQLGLVLIRKRGFYDMPSRLGASYYDWGDEIEPLTDVEDIVLNARKLECDFMFDPRLKPAATMQNAINALELRKTFNLDLEQPIGSIQYEDYQVRFDGVSDFKKHDNCEIATFEFYERSPKIFTFENSSQTAVSKYRLGDKPDPLSGDPPNWFDLANFQMTVTAVRGLGDLRSLKNSAQTVYASAKDKLHIRSFETIEIDAILQENQEYDTSYRIQTFKNLLTSPGLKDFYYDGTSYDVFWSDGFKVDSIGRPNNLKFTFKLNVV